MEVTRGSFSISDDASRLDRGVIQRFLAASYWAPGIPRDVVDRSIEGSLCFGMYEGFLGEGTPSRHPGRAERGQGAEKTSSQVGFARVVSDFATFAYVADVFVLESYRGRGLALWLMQTIRAHPRLQGIRRWNLVTRDAHALYRKVGFRDVEFPDRYMESVDRDIYRRPPGGGKP